MKRFLFVLLAIMLSSCGVLTEESDAVRAVENMGFSEVEVLDKDVFFVRLNGCGENDAAHYRVRAKNPAGKTVTVDVCVGWPFKGATVRSR